MFDRLVDDLISRSRLCERERGLEFDYAQDVDQANLKAMFALLLSILARLSGRTLSPKYPSCKLGGSLHSLADIREICEPLDDARSLEGWERANWKFAHA